MGHLALLLLSRHSDWYAPSSNSSSPLPWIITCGDDPHKYSSFFFYSMLSQQNSSILFSLSFFLGSPPLSISSPPPFFFFLLLFIVWYYLHFSVSLLRYVTSMPAGDNHLACSQPSFSILIYQLCNCYAVLITNKNIFTPLKMLIRSPYFTRTFWICNLVYGQRLWK